MFLNARQHNSDLLYKMQIKRVTIECLYTLLPCDLTIKSKTVGIFLRSSIFLLTSWNECKFLDNIVTNFVLNLTDEHDLIL